MTPLLIIIIHSDKEASYRSEVLQIERVGMSNRAARVFLNELSAIGWTDSPLFLKSITANAQRSAVVKERISPRWGIEASSVRAC